MKKKIIFGLSVFALIFFFGGIYIVATMEKTVYDLYRVSQFHHTIVLRKDLLLSIKKIQNNIIFRSARFTREDVSGGGGPQALVKQCLECHHSLSSAGTINDLQHQIETYQVLVGSILDVSPGSFVAQKRVRAALQLGDDLIEKLELIIAATDAKLEKQESEIIRGVNQRKIILFALVTVGPFFAVGLAFILIKGLTGPVRSLLDATRRLKAGDLDYRITGLRDEFAELAASFNQMAASLQEQIQAMQRAEQLKACGEMAAGLAHEIRNPLAGMKVSVEVLLAELNIEERDREVLSKVVEQIRNIEVLMKNLLNYARPVAVHPVRFNVNTLLEKMIYFIEKHPSFTSEKSSKRVIRELQDTLPEIFGDPQQLQQVFLNLLLNAADALPDEGTITVRTVHDKQAKTVAVILKDTGKGIPAELMDKIFQPFFTTKGKGKGTGLGLAVSKRIVEEHGGSIKAANNVYGGMTFTITLPIKADDEGVAA